MYKFICTFYGVLTLVWKGQSFLIEGTNKFSNNLLLKSTCCKVLNPTVNHLEFWQKMFGTRPSLRKKASYFVSHIE